MRKIIMDDSVTLHPSTNDELAAILSAWVPENSIEAELKKSILKDPGTRVRVVVTQWDPL